MAIQQGTVAKRQAGSFGVQLGAYIGGVIFTAAVKLPVGLAVRAFFGRDSGPRGCKREKFPECQWQQIMSGKRNWFD